MCGGGLLRDEQFEFRFKHITAPQLARLLKILSRNFDEKMLKDAVIFYFAKAFDTVWVEGLLYKFTSLNFSSCLVKTISSYMNIRTFEASYQAVTYTSRISAGEFRM
jgi:hypothetical protein